MNIVIFRTDKIGDMIVSSPILKAIKDKHPHARIMMVASPYNAIALKGLPQIDEMVILDNDPLSWKQKWDLLQTIKAFKPTHSLVLRPKTEYYFLALVAGIKKRGGIIMEYRWLPRLLKPILLHHFNMVPTSRKGDRLAARILKLGKEMGISDAQDTPYLIHQDTAAEAAMGQTLIEKGITGPYIAVHLVDKWTDENWQIDDVRIFLNKVRAQTGLPLVGTAGPLDKTVSTALENELPILRGLSFAQWAAVLKGAALVISPDCGAVHIACATQRPLLALYPPSRMKIAMAEFGPWQTRFFARAFDAPETCANLFLDDIRNLLKAPPK